MKTPSTPSTVAIDFEFFERGPGLDLDQQADLGIRLLEIVGHPAVAARARRGGNAAHPAWRISHGCNRVLRFLHVLDVGHEEGRRTDVEAALDQHGVVPGRPHDRGRGAALHRLQLRQQVGDVIRRVLAVEEQPVEAGVAHDVCRDIAAQAAPQADLQLAGGDRMLEGVAGEIHDAHLYTN